MTNRKKFIVIALVAIIAFVLTVWGLSCVLTKRVNAYVMNLAEKMTDEIGHPVLIDRVQIKWDWLFLKVNIKNLKIVDRHSNATLFMAGEIVSTVDTLDSLRCLSLKFKQLLLRNPRLVMQLNAQNLPIISGLSNSDVASEINPAAILKVLNMQRRIIVENGDLHLQGVDGADLPFMDLRIDCKQIADHEYSMLVRGNIAAAVQPEFVLAVHYYGDLNDVERAMLEFDIKTSNVQLDELCNFIPQLRQNVLTGNFTDLDISGVVQNGTVRQVACDFSINKVQVGKQTQIVGGVGHIEHSPGSNVTALQLAHINVSDEELYTQPITIDSVSANFVHAWQEQNLKIHTESARLKFMDLELNPHFELQFVDNKLQSLNLSVRPQDASVRRLLTLLPDRKLTANLTDWFKIALVEGEINLCEIQYKEQKLRYALGFKDAELKFAPLWPSLHGLDAELVLDDGELSINASKAMIMGTPLNHLEARFSAHEDKQYMRLAIDGVVETTLATTINYLQKTPLRDTIGSKLVALEPNGNLALGLHLDVNLATPQVSVDVQGKVDLRDSSIKLDLIDVPVEGINGQLIFTNSTLVAQRLDLKFCDEPARAKIAMHPSKASVVTIMLDTPLKISTLKRVFPRFDLSKFKGATQAQLSLEMPLSNDQNDRTLTLHSDLQGISSNYPDPFKKEAQAKLPIKFEYVMREAGNHKLLLHLSNLSDAIFWFKDHKLHSGTISINKKLQAKSNSKAGLFIDGDIAHLVWESWAPLLQAKDNSVQVPIEVDLQIRKLTFAGENYSPVHVKYNTSQRELYVDTALLTGTFILNTDTEQKIDVKLDRITVPQNMREDPSKNTALLDYLRTKRDQEQLPVVQLSCKELHFNKRTFKNIRLDLLPRTYGYEISNFSITNDNLSLQAQGTWQMDNKVMTTLAGNIQTQNFGKVLVEWGFENSITKGKGEMSFAINWDGGPMDFDLLRLAGGSHLDLRSGSLTNVNPGIGRIIGLLSLDSLHRRLQLDFSDIISKGFAFDKFIADFKIEPGNIMSDNILINSPSAKIELNGKTTIKSQDLDFTMFVTPKVGASLPIAAALAVGKVTGTWNAPEVNEIINQTDKALG